jgi:tetratricopeptide (TPR) repeat protein
MAWLNKGPTQEHLARARGFFERALALDPRNVEATVAMAGVDGYVVGTYMNDQRSALLAATEADLGNALSLAPDHALAHLRLGWTLVYTKRIAQGIAECERALALDRNLATAHAFIGLAQLIDGRPEDTERHVAAALRLSPRDNQTFVWLQFVGAAKLHLGSDEEAVTWFRRAIEMNRNQPLAHFYLAAVMGLLGRLDEARSAVSAGLGPNPTFTIARFRAGVASDNPTYLAQRERVYEGMRIGGVPER